MLTDNLNPSSPSQRIKRFILLKIAQKLHFFSWLAFLIGFTWFFLWPILSHKTYFSENALGVGQHHNKFSRDDLTWSEKQTTRILQSLFVLTKAGVGKNGVQTREDDLKMQMLSALEQSLYTIGLKTKIHSYQLNRTYFNQTIVVRGSNLYSTLRAHKGNGKESIVIKVPFPSKCFTTGSDGSDGSDQQERKTCMENVQMGLALMRCFSRQKWLHHDIIFVIADRTDKQWAGDEAFTRSQEVPTGKIREAIILDFDTFQFQSIGILTEGFNGELPNLDLVNTAIRLAKYQGIDKVSLFKYDHYSSDPKHLLPYPVYLYYRLVTHVKALVRKHIPQWRIPSDEDGDVFDKSITVIHNVYNQLVGLSTGAHAWYRKQSTHALTLTDTNGQSAKSRGKSYNMISVGNLVEGVVRSMNNLIEELHQSFFMYFMDSTMTYYGFEHYMPNLAVLLVPIALQFVGNYFMSEQQQLMHSLAYFGVTVTAGSIIYVLPFALQQLLPAIVGSNGIEAHQFFALWVGLSSLIILLLFLIGYPIVDRVYNLLFMDQEEEDSDHDKSKNQDKTMVEWKTVKAFAMSYCCIILGVLLVLESAFCIVTSMYLFIMSALLTNMHNRGVLKYLQFVALLIVSPFTIAGLVIVGNLYNMHGLDTVSWISTFDRFLSQQFINFNTNIVFICFCTLFVPVWLMFIKLVLSAMRGRLLLDQEDQEIKRKKD